MAQLVSEGLDTALDTAAERIAEGMAADIDGAFANWVLCTLPAAAPFAAAAFAAALCALAANFAGRTRWRQHRASPHATRRIGLHNS